MADADNMQNTPVQAQTDLSSSPENQEPNREIKNETRLKPSWLKPWPLLISYLLLTLAILLLASLLLPLARHWQAARAYPFQLDAEEGFILNQAVTLARGESIYQSIHQPPFLAGNYTPLFPWIYSLVNGAQATIKSLPAGRTLVELAALATALALAWIVFRGTRHIIPALLGTLLFLISYEVYHWGAFARVDFPALLLTFLGLAAFMTIRSRWALPLAAVLFIAAFYTRQTVIYAPCACLVALLLNDRRRLMWFLVPCAGLGMLVFIFLQWKTDGEFYRHVVTYNQNKLDWAGWRMLMKNEIWFWYRWLIIALALIGVLPLLLKRFNADGWESAKDLIPRTRYVTGIYALLAGLSLLSYAKIGAAPNYVLEPLAAAALWGMGTLGRLMNKLKNAECGMRNAEWDTKIIAVFRIGICLISFFLLVHAGRIWLLSHKFQWSPTPTQADRPAAMDLLNLVRGAEGNVFSEEPIFTMLAKKRVVYQPFIMSQLAREGKWDETNLTRMIAEKKFELFIATEDLSEANRREQYERYTGKMAEALRTNYEFQTRIILPGVGRPYYVWAPRNE